MISADSPEVEQIRQFDRFYETLLRKAVRAAVSEDFSAAEVRILNELGWSDRGGSGAWLSGRLDLGPARTCRVLKKLEAYGLVASTDSPTDARRPSIGSACSACCLACRRPSRADCSRR